MQGIAGAVGITLKEFVKDKADEAIQAGCDVINEEAAKLVGQIQSEMDVVGINERTGNLKGSVKITTKASVKKPNVIIKSEVFALDKDGKKHMVVNPGSRQGAGSRAMTYNDYKDGVPYGRILEFSPRYNRPFFFKVWDREKSRINREVRQKIGVAWSD